MIRQTQLRHEIVGATRRPRYAVVDELPIQLRIRIFDKVVAVHGTVEGTGTYGRRPLVVDAPGQFTKYCRLLPVDKGNRFPAMCSIRRKSGAPVKILCPVQLRNRILVVEVGRAAPGRYIIIVRLFIEQANNPVQVVAAAGQPNFLTEFVAPGIELLFDQYVTQAGRSKAITRIKQRGPGRRIDKVAGVNRGIPLVEACPGLVILRLDR